MKLSVIVVNWNTEELLGRCLASLFSQDLPVPFEVIVVDNASTDGSADMVRRRFPQAEVMASPENLGFARANNLALERAGGEYVLLLNPDAIIPDNRTLAAWLRFMDGRPEAAASGCRLVFPDGSHQVGDAGFRPTPKSVASYALFLSRLFPSLKTIYVNRGGLKDPLEVDWVCGAGLLVRRSIIQEVGKMDENIFMYAEDVEWGCRMRDFGHKLYYLPDLSIIHLQGATERTAKEGPPSFAWLENMRSLYARYSRGKSVATFDLLFSVSFFLRAASYYLGFLASGDAGMKEKGRRMGQYLRLVLRHLFNGRKQG